MAASIGNTVGLVSPFLNGNSSTSGSTTNMLAPTNTTTSSLPGTTNFNAPIPKSIPFGSVASSTAPASSSSSTPSVYQQNLNRYGLTSIPTGYAFNASGQLLNGQGQEYKAPTVGTVSPSTVNTSGSMNNGVLPSSNQTTSQGLVQSATPVTNDNTQTNNAQGQPTSVQSNVNSGGGTQTNFPSIVGRLASTAATSSPQYQQAQQAYLNAAQQLQQLQQQGAQQNAAILGGRTNLAEAGGEQGLMQNLLAGQEAALTGQMQAAQASAAAATGQQGVQQSGLAAAGGLVSPQLGQYGQTFYQPLGGTSGSAGVSPSDPFYSSMQTYAQDLVSGQTSGIPSSVTGNPALMAQLQQMAKQINPNFNLNQSTATGASQQAQTQQAQQYQSAAQQAQNYGLQLNQLIKGAGINPSDINAANSLLQKIASNTSDPNYATFQNLINDLASTYAQVLTPAGGTTTDMVRSISQSLLNSSMSGQGISQVMQNLDAQVQAKIAGVQTAYGTTNTNTTSGSQPAGWF